MLKGVFVVRYAACVVFLMSLGICSASDKQREASGLMAEADDAQNLRSANAKPFRIHMRVHAERIVARPSDGTYDEVWLSSDKWRREIAFPGFDQVEVGDASSIWMSRNLEFRPRLASLLEHAILNRPDIHPGETAVEIHDKKKNETNLRCVRLQSQHWPSSELCFDSSGALSMEEMGLQRFEYSDYSKFGGKIFPRSVHVYEKGKEVLAISVDDPTLVSDPTPKLFERMTSATQFAPCERSQRELVKKTPPHYPQEARSNHIQGTVVLYALLSGEGRVQNTKVLESAGDSLDRAAIEAVKQWEYGPASCGKTPLPTETEIQVNFALN